MAKIAHSSIQKTLYISCVAICDLPTLNFFATNNKELATAQAKYLEDAFVKINGDQAKREEFISTRSTSVAYSIIVEAISPNAIVGVVDFVSKDDTLLKALRKMLITRCNTVTWGVRQIDLNTVLTLESER